MSGRLRLTTGMTLRAATGAIYHVAGVGAERVVATGPRGSVGVDRGALENDIRRGFVGVVSWP